MNAHIYVPTQTYVYPVLGAMGCGYSYAKLLENEER